VTIVQVTGCSADEGGTDSHEGGLSGAGESTTSHRSLPPQK